MNFYLYGMLPLYQVNGVQWLWNAVHLGNPSLAPDQRIKCGLLGDEDGFHKTTQVVTNIVTKTVIFIRLLRLSKLFLTWTNRDTF
jgi:hypothetical protein